MKTVTLENIAGPAFNRAGAAGRDNFPALIGRYLTGETSLTQSVVSFVKASTKLLQGFVQVLKPQVAAPAGLLAKGGS
jgi:hypothetical protein